MFPSAFDTPWKIANRLSSICIGPYVRLLFLVNGIPWHNSWRFYGAPIIQKHRKSSIHFGSYLELRSTVRSNPLGLHHPVMVVAWMPGAVIEVGDHFAMSGGVLCAFNRISIGDRVAVGANTTIVDTDFHPINARERQLNDRRNSNAPVRIEDDVFIGMNCLILKGVTICQGSVIGAGSVVTHDVPAGVIAAGNPARVIRGI